jgi:hypothetical protein
MSAPSVGMHNTKGEFVDLYIPRKWYGPVLSRMLVRRSSSSLFPLLHVLFLADLAPNLDLNKIMPHNLNHVLAALPPVV